MATRSGIGMCFDDFFVQRLETRSKKRSLFMWTQLKGKLLEQLLRLFLLPWVSEPLKFLCIVVTHVLQIWGWMLEFLLFILFNSFIFHLTATCPCKTNFKKKKTTNQQSAKAPYTQKQNLKSANKINGRLFDSLKLTWRRVGVQGCYYIPDISSWRKGVDFLRLEFIEHLRSVQRHGGTSESTPKYK